MMYCITWIYVNFWYLNLHRYKIKEYNFINILRNTAPIIIAKHLNIIFKFYISSNRNDALCTGKSAEETRGFQI